MAPKLAHRIRKCFCMSIGKLFSSRRSQNNRLAKRSVDYPEPEGSSKSGPHPNNSIESRGLYSQLNSPISTPIVIVEDVDGNQARATGLEESPSREPSVRSTRSTSSRYNSSVEQEEGRGSGYISDDEWTSQISSDDEADTTSDESARGGVQHNAPLA